MRIGTGTVRSWFGRSGVATVSTAVSTYTMRGALSAPLRTTGSIRMANAAKLTGELFRILISGRGNRFRVAVICASSEKAQTSTDATEIMVLIPILASDRREINLF